MTARLTHAEVLAHCLAKSGAWEDMPWEGDVVAKVHDKIFAFLGGGAGSDGGQDTGQDTGQDIGRDTGQDTGTVAASVGLKCGADRAEADEWLERFPDDASVMAYLGRSGWNTLVIGRAIPDVELLEAVDESYARVVERLPKKHRPPGWDR